MVKGKWTFKKVRVGNRWKNYTVTTRGKQELYQARVQSGENVCFVRMSYDDEMGGVVEIFVYDEGRKKVVVELLGVEANDVFWELAYEFGLVERNETDVEIVFEYMCRDLDTLFELVR